MNVREEERLATALNGNLAIYHGCTLSELLVIVLSSAVANFFVWIVLSELFFSVAWPGLVLGFGLGLASFHLLVRYLERLKRGKPRGFYQQYLILKLDRWGVWTSPFIIRLGYWSLRRSIKNNKRVRNIKNKT